MRVGVKVVTIPSLPNTTGILTHTSSIPYSPFKSVDTHKMLSTPPDIALQIYTTAAATPL